MLFHQRHDGMRGFLLCFLVLTSTVYQTSAQCVQDFCANGKNCASDSCRDCLFACNRSGGQQCEIRQLDNHSCGTWCSPNDCSFEKCSDCLFCTSPRTTNYCPLGSFDDITQSMFSGDLNSDFWYSWKHSGKPYTHFTSPIVVDINDDGLVDYFSSMHGGSQYEVNRMELALGRKSGDGKETLYLSSLRDRIILEDLNEGDGYSFLDAHSDVMVDLDNDGILDIFTASGGGSGRGVGVAESRDNFLFFGEKGNDENNVPIFRGGRKQALDSNVHMRMSRAKFTYLLDANQDGLLDIFIGTDRRVDNLLVPGVLLVNQGGRTWKEDKSMSEFTSTMMLTDADGDGLADEFMVMRDFCFPKREDPNNDAEFGPFSSDVKQFCSTRPVGSMAVFRYNKSIGGMQEISQTYTNILPTESSQPECCPHNLFTGDNDCSPVSMASGDFDGDRRADHVVLYSRKIVFYFSSERPTGALPVGNEYIGLTIQLPQFCARGLSVRVVDLNNSGQEDIVVMCWNSASFLVYTKGATKESWTLNNGCNTNGALGDIAFPAFEWTNTDIDEACSKRATDETLANWKKLGPICDRYDTDGLKTVPLNAGLTLADIDSDGFTDAIVTTEFGYEKYFLNKPSLSSKNNKFISFRLLGDGSEVNKYGIGVTLLLYTKTNSGTRKVQFREISSHQHGLDKHGNKDEKTTFGLGANEKPVKIFATWPNGRRQVVFLRRFGFSPTMEPIKVTYPPRGDAYFKLVNQQSSASGQKLCLSTGSGDQWRDVQIEECTSSTDMQQFKFDTAGRLRSRIHDDFCVTPRYTDSSILLIRCSKKQAKGRSWHLTQDNSFLRQAGSNMVLSVASAKSGEGAIIAQMNSSGISQKWSKEKKL